MFQKLSIMLLSTHKVTYYAFENCRADPGGGGGGRVPWNPPFERASHWRYSNKAVAVFLRGACSVASYYVVYK